MNFSKLTDIPCVHGAPYKSGLAPRVAYVCFDCYREAASENVRMKSALQEISELACDSGDMNVSCDYKCADIAEAALGISKNNPYKL